MILADYPGHLLAIALAVGLCAILYGSYRARHIQSAGRWRWVLGILHFAALLALLVVLWNPSRPRIQEEEERNSVLVVFDTSESMSVKDGGEDSRLDRALGAFHEQFDAAAPEAPIYRIVGFDSAPYESDSIQSLRRWGYRSNLSGVFDSISEAGAFAAKDDEGHVVGAVVFTDGQADSKVLSSYAQLKGAQLDVLIVGVGEEDKGGDVAVRGLEAPTQVQIDSAYTVNVLVSGTGLGEEPVRVEMLQDGASVAVEAVMPDTLNATGVAVPFKVAADVLGEHILTARVFGPEDEANPANNERSTSVYVVDHPNSRVLLYTQRADFNIGKVRQALIRDKKVSLDFGMDALVDPDAVPAEPTYEGQHRLPEDRAGLYAYDVIILGPCDFDSLTDEQLDGLYSFVVDRGGGLVFLPGRDDWDVTQCHDRVLRALLPVASGGEEPAPGTPGGRIELPEDALSYSVLTREDLEQFPVVAKAHHTGLPLKPAAHCLACVGEEPALYAHRVGRGRVCLVNACNLYEWYNAKEDGGLLAKFISGVTAYVGRVDDRESGVEVFAEWDQDVPGRVCFGAQVYDAAFEAVSDATVLLEFKGRVMRMTEREGGRYEAAIDGVSTESVVASVSAERGGVFLGSRNAAIQLPTRRQEMDEVRLDAVFLGNLAEEVGGEYVHVRDLKPAVAQRFDGVRKVDHVASVDSVWRHWGVLAGICGLLTVLWFIRRGVGLV